MSWPDLRGASGAGTSRTLQLWTQIVGKTRLALAPMVNHWWQVTFRVSARGLNTRAIPYQSRQFEVEFDLTRHELSLRSSDGGEDHFPLESGPIAAFYARYFAGLRKLGIEVAIRPEAVEIVEAIRLDRDQTPREYDPDWAHRFFLALLQADRLLAEFRSSFIGKVSPVQFFWGSFDLAVTRFSGRDAPLHPGGAPHCADYVMQEAYSHEVSSAGFWPGDARFPEAAFYSYSYPEPPGFSQAHVLPDAARYEAALGEFVLPYEAARSSNLPDREVLVFLESTYEAAAELAGWNRAALERARRSGSNQPSMEASHELRM